MSTTIGSLIAELGLDDSKYRANLKLAQAEGLKAAREVEKAFHKSTAVANLKLTPEVDDRQLTALNAHLTLKEKHVDKFQRTLTRNPLTPRVDTSQLEKLDQALNKVEASYQNVLNTSSVAMSSVASPIAPARNVGAQRQQQQQMPRIGYDSRSGRYRYLEGEQQGRIVRDRDLANIRPNDSPYIRQGQMRVRQSADRRDARAFKNLFAAESEELATVIENSVEKGVEEGIYGGAVRKAFRGLGFLFGGVVEGALGQLGSFAFTSILEKGFGIEETIKIDAAQIDQVTQALTGTEQKVESIVGAIEGSISGLGDRLAVEIETGVRKGLEPSRFEKLLNFATGGLTSGLAAVMQGLYEEIGAGFGAEISAGLVRSFESNFEINLQQFGRNKGERVFPLLREGYRRTEGAQIAVEDTAKLVGDRVRLAGFRLGDGIAAALDEPQLKNKLSALVDNVDFSGWNAALEDIGEQLNDIVTEFNNTLFAGMSEIKFLDDILYTNRVEGVRERGVPRMLDRVQQLHDPSFRDDDAWARSRRGNALKAINENTRELFIATGGYAGAEGKSGRRLRSEISPYLSEDQAFITTDNPYSDLPEDAFDSSRAHLMETAKSLLKPNIKGYNPDAVEMAAQAMAAKLKNPEIQIKFLGESGGSAVAEEAVELLKNVGIEAQYLGVGGMDLLGSLDRSAQGKVVSKDDDVVKSVVDKTGLLARDSMRNTPLRGSKTHEIPAYIQEENAELANYINPLIFESDEQIRKYITGIKETFDYLTSTFDTLTPDKFREEFDIQLANVESDFQIPSFLDNYILDIKSALEQARLGAINSTEEFTQDFEQLVKQLDDLYVSVAGVSEPGVALKERLTPLTAKLKDIENKGLGSEEFINRRDLQTDSKQVLRDIQARKREIGSGTEFDYLTTLETEARRLYEGFGDVTKAVPEPIDIRPRVKTVPEPVLEAVSVTPMEESVSTLISEAEGIGRQIGLAAKEVLSTVQFEPVKLDLPERTVSPDQLAQPQQLVREMESRIQSARSLINADPNASQNILQGIVDEFAAIESTLRDLLDSFPVDQRMSSDTANQLTNLLSRIQRVETVQQQMLTSLSNTNRPPPGEALTNLRNTFTDQTRLLTTDSTPQEQRIAAAKGILSRGDDIKSQLTQLRGSENLPESTRKQISTVKGQITRAQKEASAFLEGIGIDASEAGADLTGGLVTGINQSMADVEGAIQALVNQVRNETEEGFEISSPSKLFKRYGRFLSLGLIEGIKAVDLTESTNDLISQLDPLVNKAKETFQELKDSGELRNKLQEVTVNAAGYAGSVAGGVMGGLPGTLIGDSGGALLARKVTNDLLAVYDAIAEGNAKGIFEILKRAREIKLEPENIAEANRNYREDLTGFTVGNTVGMGLPGVVPLQGAMAAMYSTSDIVDMIDRVRAGEGKIDTLKQGGKNLATKPLTGIKQIFSMIEKAISSEDLDRISDEIVDGITQGLEDTGLAQDQARDLANDIVQAAKDELDIQSPSGVFEKIGRMCLAGFEKGISEFRASKAGNVVETQLSQWVEDLKQTAQQKATEIETAVQGLTAQGQTEATRLLEESVALGKQLGSDFTGTGATEARTLSGKLRNLEASAFNAPGAGGEWEEALRQQVENASNVLEQLADQAETVSNALNQELPDTASSFEEVTESIGPLDSALSTLKGVGLSVLKLFIGFQALTFLSDFMMQFGAASLESALSFERLSTSLKFVLGSASDASEAIRNLRDEAQELGIGATGNIQGFQEIAASTRGTSLEGVATGQIATAASQAQAAFLLTDQEAGQITRALSQMASKGVISTEEIRQQMGEVLPGAFQVAARSMGVTTSELNNMLARGEVLSSQFLPKFAQQLSAETAAGIAGASKTAQASLNRLTNQIEELQIAFGQQLLPVQKIGADILAAALEKLVDIFPTLVNLAVTLAAVFAIRFAVSIGLAGKVLSALTDNFAKARTAAQGLTFAEAIKGLKGMKTALSSAAKAMLTFGLQMLAVQAAIAAVRLAWQFFSDSSGDLGDFAEASTRGVDNLVAKLQQLQEETGKTNEALSGMGNRSQRDQLASVQLEGAAGDILQNDIAELINDRLSNYTVLGRVASFVPGVGEEGLLGVAQRTFAADQLSDQSARIAEMGAERERLSGIAASYLDGGTNADRTDEYIRVQQQLKSIQQQESALRILDPADVEALEKITAAKDELLSRQGPLVEEVEGIRAQINAEIQTINNAMSSLEESLKTGAISPEKFAVGMADYEAQLADAVADQEAFNDALDGTANRLSQLSLEFQMISARIADASATAQRSVAGDRQRLAQARLSGASSGAVGFTGALIDQRQLEKEFDIVQSELGNLEIQLETPKLEQLLDNIRKIEPALDEMGSNQLSALRERFAEDPEYTQAINTLAQAQEARLQTQELATQIVEARADAAQSIRDANREITQYYREVTQQSEELALQTREVAAQADFADIKNKLKSAMTGMSGSFFDDWIGGILNFLDKLQEIVQIQIDANRQKEQTLQQQLQAQMQATQMERGMPGVVPGIVGSSGGFVSPLAGQSVQSLLDYAPSDRQDFHATRDQGTRIHRGIDIDSRAGGGLGAQVLASLGGTASVYDIDEQKGDVANSVGIAIASQLGNGIPIEIRYNHLNLNDVRRDLGVGIGGTTQVGAGQALGTVVNHHLDYKVLVNGEHVDPQEFMAAMASGGGVASTVDGRPIQIVASAPTSTSSQMPVALSTAGLTVKGQTATQEQIDIAQRIYQVGSSLGATNDEIRSAIATAIQESVLTNLNDGHKDSLGIFQQRPSMEWGSRAQIANPDFAIESFFLGRGSNRGMIENRDRAGGDVYLQSHHTQRSAHPDEPRQWDSEAAAFVREFSGGGQPVGLNTGQFNQAQGLQNQNFAMDIELIERRAALAVEQAELEANTLFRQLMGTADRQAMEVEDRRTGIDRGLQDRTIQSIPQGDLQSRTQEAVSAARGVADSNTQYLRDIQQLTADVESFNEALATMEQSRDVVAAQLDTPGAAQQLANYDAIIERTRSLRDASEDLLNDTQEAFSGALDFERDSAMAEFERQAEEANIAAGNVDPVEAATADLRREITALEDYMDIASQAYRESIENLYPEETVDEMVEAFNVPNQIKLDAAVEEVEKLEESLLAAQEAAFIEIRTESLGELSRILNRSGQGGQAQELLFQNQRDQLDVDERNRISNIRDNNRLSTDQKEQQINEVRTMFDYRRENLAFDQEMSAGERDRTLRQESLDTRQGLLGAQQQQADMLGFGGIAPLRQEEMNLALEQQQIDYEAQIANLYATTDAAGRTTEAFAEMQAAIEQTNQLSIENIKTQFSDLPEIIGAIKQPMTDALSSWIQGTKSFDEAFSDMLGSIMSNLISMMANKAIEGLLGNLLGGTGGTGAGNTGGIPGFGGGFGGIIGSVFGGLFKDGGKVGQYGLIPNFAAGGHLRGSDPIKDAMKKEGPGARLIVANTNEWILNRRHQEILKAYGVDEKVLGFKGGGPVGGQSFGSAVRGATGGDNGNVSVNIPITVNGGGGEDDGRELAKRLADPIKALVSSEVARMRKPGGQLRPRR